MSAPDNRVTHPDRTARLSADILLADGSTVHVRPIKVDDADRVVAMHSRFSDRTRYLRYFSPYPRIPPRDLARFITVDHWDREALVACLGPDIIAVGRYDRLGPGATDAEVAFVVADDHQGRGIGSALLEHLAAAAVDVDITRFVAEVLPQNGPMLRVFADAGYQVSRAYADGVVHLTFPIAPTSRSIEVSRRRETRTEAASIARILRPRAVGIYGVRRDGTGVGAAVAHYLADAGWTGPVYAIRPDATSPHTTSPHTTSPHTASPHVIATALDALEPIDLAIAAVPADRMAQVVADAGAAGVHAVVVLSAGFAETGRPGADRQRELVAAAHAAGMRVVGPNSLGVINPDPRVRLNASLISRLPEPGRVGIFCQSAAVGIAVLAETHLRGLGVASFVSVGNRADVSGNDLMQFWRDDPGTDVILLYLETFGNPRKFARIARDVGRDKPIVMVAAGAAGLPHPDGAIRPAGLDDDAMAALIARSGVIRVATIDELCDVGRLLAHQPLPAGDRVSVLGNAPALIALGAGACAQAGLVAHVPASPCVSPDDLTTRVRDSLADVDVDAILVVISPPVPETGVETPEHIATLLHAVRHASADADKPILLTLVGADLPQWRELSGVADPDTSERPVPVFATVEHAVRGLGRVASYARWRREPLGTLPELSDVDFDRARRVVDADGVAPDLLDAYGIEVTPEIQATGTPEVLAAAERLGYPVVIKSARPGLRHRLDLGAVRLGLGDERELLRAHAELTARFGPHVLVQPQARPGVACVVDVVDHATFGPIIGFSVGGITSDLLGDWSWRAAPLTDLAAAELVRAPRAAALLHGYRGATPVDTQALTDLLLRLSRLADEHPRVRRLVCNPVLAHARGLAVVHAEVTYGEATSRPDTGPRRLG